MIMTMCYGNWFCVIVSFALFCISSISSKGGSSRCGKVHLTVSSYAETFLELNWITDCQRDATVPEYIILSTKNIQDRDEDHGVLKMVKFKDYPDGFFRTKVKFGHPWLPGGWEVGENVKPDPGPHCFPYWISSVSRNGTIDSTCLAIQPTWMSDNSVSLGNLRLGSILIPGTHNSGSYSGIVSFLENYILNQDRSIWTQLVSGIRYLDFRIGYYEKEGFYLNHDLVRVTKILPLLQDIKKFLQQAPKEIVVLDFHRFPFPTNFSLSLHRKFVDLIYSELGAFAVPSVDMEIGKGPTLNDIWKKNKNLIICYADKTTVRENYFLWHPLSQYWGNTKSESVLKSFLEKSISEQDNAKSVNPFWALMAELTPQPIDLVFRTNNLRKLAAEINPRVTKWFRDEWGAKSNIVATDYFLGNDMINVAIDINTHRNV
ncbi:unnamed protein product [Phaedon cochleariae]|uniref:Uncharacterized protein n=1 Tax=Phaedon cochleariae TaxID=80249 RepID=A0A9P0GR62_PHACE|nr:unnamed protein product [Phaedon cochleariae]